MNNKTARLIRRVKNILDPHGQSGSYRAQKRAWNKIPRNLRHTARLEMKACLEAY